eukprot:Nk52_evm46s745 gene=Nk52_evmTU46s745
MSSSSIPSCASSSSLRQLAIVTGASKGFGRAIALALASNRARLRKALLPEHSSCGDAMDFLLVARDQEALSQTKTLVKEAAPDACVEVCCCDLQDTAQIKAMMKRMESKGGEVRGKISVAYLINNAGSVGDLSAHIRDFGEADRFEEIDQYFRLNVTSPFALTAAFLAAFGPSGKGNTAKQKHTGPGESAEKCVVVNISSLLAVQPMEGWGLYSSGKIARNTMLGVVKCEEDAQRVRALNYAPGPLMTEMFDKVCTDLVDKETRAYFSGLRDKNEALLPGASAEKLMDVLSKDEYESGQHIDYYDV